jgi:1,2-diacylglycerol 3-alpha-glucosyltransferase
MRILISSSTYYPSMNGQAVFTTNLAEGMARKGHSVLVLLDSHHVHASRSVINGVVIEELRSISLNVFHAGVYFSPFPGKDVRRLFNDFQPEIVHVQDHYPSCRATMVEARKRGIKIVGSNHFVPENIAPYIPLLTYIKPVVFWVLWQWMLDVYKRTDVITAQSKAAANIIRQQGLKQPVLSISCGIDLQRLYPTSGEERLLYCQRYGLDPTKKIFLFLGRIDGEKRIDLLVQAMRQLQRDDIQMAIAGHGGVERSLKRMVATLGLTEKVRFTGFIPAEDVPGLLNSTDVFVMPSEAELLSISTLEAMACGRPVLLADALALPELVRDGENGYLFKPGDVDDLVRLINQLADHPEYWRKMGITSREIASQHSLEDTIHKFESVYASLLNEVPAIEPHPPVKETV